MFEIFILILFYFAILLAFFYPKLSVIQLYKIIKICIGFAVTVGKIKVKIADKILMN